MFCLCVPNLAFIHASSDGRLECFHLLAAVSKGYGCTSLFASLHSGLLGIYIEEELLHPMAILCLIFGVSNIILATVLWHT